MRIVNPAMELRSEMRSTVMDDGPAIAVLRRWPSGLSTGPRGALSSSHSGEAYNNRATIMASCPESKYRDGKGAVESATRACELSDWRRPDYLSTLAAAYAENGDFDAAIRRQTRATEMLPDERQKDAFRSGLALYQANNPYREPAPEPRPD